MEDGNPDFNPEPRIAGDAMLVLEDVRMECHMPEYPMAEEPGEIG